MSLKRELWKVDITPKDTPGLRQSYYFMQYNLWKERWRAPKDNSCFEIDYLSSH